MKSEAEIRTRLNYYKGVLAGFMAGHSIDKSEIFLAMEQSLPGKGLVSLRLTAEMDKAIANLPLNQQGIKEVFEDYVRHVQEFIEGRISILKWILDENDMSE